VASWLQEVRASFCGPIDVLWPVTAEDSDLQSRLDDEVADVADDDLAVHELFNRLREWNEFVVHSRDDVLPFVCRSSDACGHLPYLRADHNE